MDVKRLTKRALTTLIMSMMCAFAYGQNNVSGTVKDATGSPVIGATVVVVGTAKGTTTDADGRYVFSGVANNASIEVSFIGYATQTQPVNSRSVIDFVLEEDTTMVDEVVVTAYGQVKQAKQVGYATTRVDVSEIERTNAINPVNALQGKVAGVQIDVGGASGLTSSSSITIRGAKSIDKNNSPIWVVDGMVMQEPPTGVMNGADWGSQLKNLNPADYESVTVLKGAAATALYGSRGANGAIVIVSKSGRGMKRGIGVEINQTLEWTDVYRFSYDLQNEYGAGTWYADFYDGGFAADGTLLNTTNSWGPKFDGRLVNQRLPHGRETAYVAHPNNWKALFQTGLNSTTNVAISGGTDKSAFRLSYGYTDNNGVFKNNEFNRHNISFRGNTELNRVFSIEMGVQYAFSNALNASSQGGWDYGNQLGMIIGYYMPRNYDIADHAKSYRNDDGKVQTDNSTNSTITSYLWNRDMNENRRQENSMLADLTLRAHIADWLDASVKGNYNYYAYNHMSKGYPQQLEDNAAGYSFSRSGQTQGSYNFVAMLQSNDIQLDRSGDFKLSVIAAAEMYGNIPTNYWFRSTRNGFVIPGVFSFNNSKDTPQYSGTINMTYTPRNQQTVGVFGIANFAWKDQVFVEVTARNDWLSTLTYPSYVLEGQNNYSVFYPSINASWVFSDTFHLPEWLSMGRLRASLSRVGMGTSAYATIDGFGVFNSGTSKLPDGSGDINWANPNLGTAFNPNLKPEIQQSMEFGLDLRFFNERLNLDATYYKTNTFNQILSVGATAESGASSMKINAGNIQNQGMEITLEGIPVLTKDWRWSVGTNVSFNRGKIKKLHDNIKEWQLMGSYEGGPEIWAYEGGAFGVLTTLQNNSASSLPLFWEGEAGDPRNGMPVLAYEGTYNGTIPMYWNTLLYERNEEGDRDRHIIGKVEPDCLLSINTSLSWKNLDLYISADGRFGGNFFSSSWNYASTTGALKSSLKGRDASHGGLKRINEQGQTVYNGYMINGVFAEGEQAPLMNPDGTLGEMVDVGGMTYADAVNKLGIAPTTTGAWYAWNYGWGSAVRMGENIQDNTWFMLREISLGYRLPERICQKFGANYLRIGFTARNICYIVNKLADGLNPQSISNNNPLTPMDIGGGVPYSRTFSFNLTVRF